MSEYLDMRAIYRQERQHWMKEEAPRKSVRDGIAESVPYWIILVAVVLFGLSAPYTAGVFDKLTPGWGWLAPGRLINVTKQTLPWTLWALEILLFLTAMLVNGAGSFTSVVAAKQLDKLSFASIVEGFGQLPATTQAALIIAVLSAFIIPIGTLVAGDGLAAWPLSKILGMTTPPCLQQGLPEQDAWHRAYREVKGYLGSGSPSGVRMLSALNGQTGQTANGQKMSEKDSSVKGQVRAYMDANPALAQYSVNQVFFILQSAGVRAGRTTVAEVLQERKHEV